MPAYHRLTLIQNIREKEVQHQKSYLDKVTLYVIVVLDLLFRRTDPVSEIKFNINFLDWSPR